MKMDENEWNEWEWILIMRMNDFKWMKMNLNERKWI